MGLSRFSIRHPVPVIVFFLIVVLLGLVSFSRLAVDLFPDLQFPVGVVVTSYEGAGPQEIESLVSKPIEEAVGTINNVKTIRSTSSEGLSLVVVEFNWGTDMNFATLQMREKVDQVKRFLPEDVEQPLVTKVDPSSQPVMTLGLVAAPAQPGTKAKDLVELRQIAEKTIKPRLERLEGVAAVTVTGGLKREIQVFADPSKLGTAGLSLQSLVQALRQENLNLPGGEIRGQKQEVLVRTTGQFSSLSQIENLLVHSPGGAVYRLRDLAQVRDGFADVTQRTGVDGRPSLTLGIQKQPGSNSVQVNKAILQEVEKLRRDLGGAVELKVLYDESQFVKRSISNAADSAISGGLLAVLVIYLFLRSARSTAVVALAIPISIITTFTIIYFSGITLNMMSLGGLALGIGMLVDDAIVVLENIYRHKEEGKDPEEAAAFGTGEVMLAVIASTLSTMVVFLPIVFVEGIAARFFREMALTVSFSLAASLAVSLTLVPMLSARILKKGPAAATGRGRWWNPLDAFSRFWHRTDSAYRRLLAWSLRHRKLTLAVAGGAFVGSMALFPLIGSQFVPQMDTGELQVVIELPSGTALPQTEAVANQVEQIVRAIPEVQTISKLVGGTSAVGLARSGSGSNYASVNARLVPLDERKRRIFDVIEEVRQKTASIPGAKINVAVFGGVGAGSGPPIAVNIKGDDLAVLRALADQAVALVKQVPGTREVDHSLAQGRPEIQIRINREKAASLGLSAAQVADAVKTAVSGQVASQYRVGGNEYDIRVRASEGARADLTTLQQLRIATPGGALVPLADVAGVAAATGPVTIQRNDQSKVVQVSAYLQERDLGSATREIQGLLDALPMPAGYRYEFAGQIQQMRESFGSLALALVLAVVLTYLVLVAQFESFLNPFIIMFSVPLAFIGSVLALVITRRSLDVSAFIGVILLVGIVVKNAIVLIDYINTLRKRGMERNAAVIQAGPTRLRPVMMTTATTVLGMLPLALGIGDGAEQQAPMATIVIGGLTVSTLLTLVVVPVVYTIFDDIIRGDWWRWLRGAVAGGRDPVRERAAVPGADPEPAGGD